MDTQTDDRSDSGVQPIEGHKYDGIQEYDNPMPGWWVWLFWITVIFGVVYYVGITFGDFVDTYEDDLAEGLAELEVRRAAFESSNPEDAITEETVEAVLSDPAGVAAGAASYAAYCLTCHGEQGQGLIGPNLTDEFWIREPTAEAVYTIITDGILEKGMPPWEAALTPEQRVEVIAFLRTLEGTTPPNPKDPQGEPYTRDGSG